MTLTDFFRDLQKETAQKIRQAEAAEKDVLKRAYSCVSILTDANASLKTFIINYQFENEEEEIWFFKHAKPSLISQYIYHCQVYNIEMDRPVGGMNIQRDYLDRELENLQDFIDRRPEFYSYYRLGSTDNDVCYFTRDKFVLGHQYLEPTMSEREPRYSTNCDYKLAKILANEQLEILIKSQLDELERPNEEKGQLPWMTKKAFLIELLYALDSFRAFGRIPLKRIVAAVQKLMGIDLGNYSSEFARMRDRDNPTPFLDALKDALLQRMKRSNERRRRY